MQGNLPLQNSTSAPVTARKMCNRYSGSSRTFINTSSVSVHTAICILAFSSSTSTIGVVKTVLDVTPKEKIKRSNIWRLRRPGCWSIPYNDVLKDPSMVVLHLTEKLSMIESILTERTITTRHVKEHWSTARNPQVI